jgi:hypothetical protein
MFFKIHFGGKFSQVGGSFWGKSRIDENLTKNFKGGHSLEM